MVILHSYVKQPEGNDISDISDIFPRQVSLSLDTLSPSWLVKLVTQGPKVPKRKNDEFYDVVLSEICFILFHQVLSCFSGWWFGTFVIFPYIVNNHPS